MHTYAVPATFQAAFAPTTLAEIGVITAREAKALIDTKDAKQRPVVLDTRGGYKDYIRDHVPTAHHLEFDTRRGTDQGVPVQYLKYVAGYPKVRLYEGAWKEYVWLNNKSLPAETKESKAR